MTLQIGRYYWVRLGKAEAKWQPGERIKTDYGDGWHLLAVDAEYYDNEIKEVGPEITPPANE